MQLRSAQEISQIKSSALGTLALLQSILCNFSLFPNTTILLKLLKELLIQEGEMK